MADRPPCHRDAGRIRDLERQSERLAARAERAEAERDELLRAAESRIRAETRAFLRALGFDPARVGALTVTGTGWEARVAVLDQRGMLQPNEAGDGIVWTNREGRWVSPSREDRAS